MESNSIVSSITPVVACMDGCRLCTHGMYNTGVSTSLLKYLPLLKVFSWGSRGVGDVNLIRYQILWYTGRLGYPNMF